MKTPSYFPALKPFVRTLAALLAGAAISLPAQAFTVGDAVTIDAFAQGSGQFGLAFWVNADGKREAAYAGQFQGTLNHLPFTTYCVDLWQDISLSSTVYSNFSQVQAGSPTLSWFTSAKAYDLGRLFTGYAASVNNAITSSAMQLAIWEIISETGGVYDLLPGHSSSGNFTASRYFGNASETQALNLAETWVQHLPSASSYFIAVEYSPTKQDMIIANYLPLATDMPHINTPEPSQIALVGLGLAALSLTRRRLPC